jgi:hypothetical protein
MAGNRKIGSGEAPLERDARLGALLSEAYSLSEARRVLPWQRALDLIDAAPPLRLAWHQRLLGPSPRPLRYALAPLALLTLCLSVLTAIPAQSEFAGLVVLTDLPGAWTAGSEQIADFELGAREAFFAAAPDGAELFLLGTKDARSGRPRMALTMLHVEQAAAHSVYAALQARYPALKAFEPSFESLGGRPSGSLLRQVAERIVSPDRLPRLDDAGLKLHVLEVLHQAGLEAKNIVVTRQADGSAVVDVDAEMRFTVGEREQEDLEAAGLRMTP